jgi:hypothetical protein
MEESCFQFEQKYYKQTEELAMGAPALAILAEIFIQHIQNKHLYPVLKTQEIIAYYMYVDDILIIYDQSKIII